MLSRISWPVFTTKQVLARIQSSGEGSARKRVCIQALNYPEVFAHVESLVKAVKKRADMPISVSCQPLVKDNIRRVAEAGAERIGIPLDAATQRLFKNIKGASAGGPYTWRGQFGLLEDAVSIFGRGMVSTHLIVGLGESEKEMIYVIQRCVNMGVFPALFAFTPVLGTQLERESQPPIDVYRRVQVARSLILRKTTTVRKMRFDEHEAIVDFGVDKKTLAEVVRWGEPFRTTGCPDCNRPYYNEKPSGPIYNFPRKSARVELSEIEAQFGLDEA
jgi:biotin synthase